MTKALDYMTRTFMVPVGETPDGTVLKVFDKASFRDFVLQNMIDPAPMYDMKPEEKFLFCENILERRLKNGMHVYYDGRAVIESEVDYEA